MNQIVNIFRSFLDSSDLVITLGSIQHAVGTIIEGIIPDVFIGEICEIYDPDARQQVVIAEVIGFTSTSTLLSPLSPIDGIATSFVIRPLRKKHSIDVSEHLLSRVLDGFGSFLIESDKYIPQHADVSRRAVISPAPNPVNRPRISMPFATGVRAIDTMLTVGDGQRFGIFAGPGCGKTSLMAAIARGAEIDVLVIALIGERGRELREFTEHELDPEVLKKTVLVCATSDRSAMERVRAAFTATAIAEAFRDMGKRVLLMIDSLTRLSRAQREIGLAAGEPPARGGFPPSVYALLPRLIERAGLTGSGSITAFYTVLLEGDIKSDPISEEVVSLLDGHIFLSKKLAEAGHFPAIDVLPSISRIMSNIVSNEHNIAAGKVRKILSCYQNMELLIRLGEYKRGLDADVDAMIDMYPQVVSMLKQNTKIPENWNENLHRLYALFDNTPEKLGG